MPEGWGAQLMRGNLDRLVEGAARAGDLAQTTFSASFGAPLEAGPDQALALLVRCIGRHLLLGQRAEEELRAVGAAVGSGFTRVGFCSHGEVAPDCRSGLAMLQNQTTAVTLLAEGS